MLAPPAPAVQGQLPDPPRFANEPHAEFYLPGVRDGIYAALERVRGTFGREVPARINFEPVPCDSFDEVRPPAHPDQVMAQAARSTHGMAAKAVDAAARAFPGWRDTPGHERAAMLRRAADILVSRREELTATMVFECAKPWAEADGDVTEAVDFIRYYALQAEDLDEGEDLSLVPAETNRLIHEGRGVAAVIAPWNFPLAIFSGMTCGALAAGCTVVSKPAEQSPVVASMLIDALEEAGAPPGIVHFLPGRGEEVGEALITDPRVTTIAFTGSNAVGLHINEVASKTQPGQPMIRKVIAELGGKNAIVVDEDADLDQAVAGVLTSAFGYAGQKCSACSRVIAVGNAYEPFRERLRAAVESLVVGPAEDPYTRVPPVISAEARESIEGYIRIGHEDGRLLARGPSCEGGHYVAPHVFEDIPGDSRLWREEVFGPVLVLSSAPTFEAGVDQALDTPFALTGGIFSRNPRNIEAASRRFRVGNFYVNRAISGSMVGRQPFAGFGMSGTGEKAGGPGYVREFTVARVVTENTMRRGFAPGSRS
ncbi:MAG: aldehyde dehydrogenase family protein [Dehalococcoidia bacterium]|nr:aldehyde dehydrogenase family protein [Dehalococcoidia bacterium]